MIYMINTLNNAKKICNGHKKYLKLNKTFAVLSIVLKVGLQISFLDN